MTGRLMRGREWVLHHPLASAVVLVLFARLAFLSGTGMSLDDLKYFDSLPPKEFLLSQGRFGWVVADRLFYSLGMAGPYWYVHASVVGCALLAVSGATLARLALLDAEPRYSMAAIAAGVLFAVHPFHAEALSFREAFPFYALAISCGTAGLLTLERARTLWAWLAGAALITLAISIYQLVLNVLAVVLLFRIMAELGTGIRLRELTTRRPLMSMLGGCVLGTLVFLLAMKVILVTLGITPDSRAQALPIADLPQRVSELFATASSLVRFQQLFPAPLLSGLLMLLAAIGCIRAIAAGAGWPARGAILLLLLLVPLAAIGVVGVGAVFWPAPRTLVGFAFATGMLLALAGRRPSARLATPALAALGVIYAAFCVIGDTVALDQSRLNARDRHTAALIDNRAGALGARRIAFVGHWQHGPNVRTRSGDMSLSAFAIPWSRAPALTEYTGRPWEVVDASARADWGDRCQQLGKWPHATAVFFDVDTAVICL